MIRIHGLGRSRASRNLWLLRETGVPFELVPVIQAYRLPDPDAADAPMHTRSPEFLALSPAGAIPVMEDDGFVLTESFAINLYLAQRYGGTLGPTDAKEAALMTQWALYGATSIETPALGLMTAVQGGKGDAEAEIARHAAALSRPLAVVEAKLAAEGHPVGGRFTVADINLAEVIRYAATHPPMLDPYPATKAWLAECHARPAFKAMMEARLAEPV